MNPQQTEDESFVGKYGDMKKRLYMMEEANNEMQVKLDQARKKIKRLHAERFILLDRLEEYREEGALHSSRARKVPDSTANSDSSGSESMASDMIPTTSKTPANRSRTKQTQKDSTPAPARKKKDPNAPKGPGNVFFVYCRLERDNIKDELPNESLGEVTRALGQKWKTLPKEEKQKYHDMYKQEQEEYEKAMETYNAGGGANQSSKPDVKREEETAEGEADEDIDMLQDEDEDVDTEASNDIATSTAPVTHTTNSAVSLINTGSGYSNEPKLSSIPSPSLHAPQHATSTHSPLSQVHTVRDGENAE